MKRKWRKILPAIVIVIAVIILIRYFSRPEPLKVKVSPVEKGIVERTVANTRAGTVEACRRAKLSPSIGGQILRLLVKEGDKVKAGDLLLELWNEDLKAEVLLAGNEIQTAGAQEVSTCLRAEEARRESNRLEKLRKIGAAAEDKADQALTTARALKAECEGAGHAVQVSESRLGFARARLERTQLVAPFAGVIAQINGELNEYLTPSPPGIPTPPAIDLIDDSCFYVTAPIDEVDASEITPGMPARITMDAFGDLRFPGKVRRIAPFVLDREKQARTVDVEVEFTNPGETDRLLAGYSADVEIVLESRADVLRIPTEAVLDGKRVFVYSPGEGVIRERRFQKGIANWNLTEVVSGLKPGEKVVVNVDQAGIKDNIKAVISEDAG